MRWRHRRRMWQLRLVEGGCHVYFGLLPDKKSADFDRKTADFDWKSADFDRMSADFDRKSNDLHYCYCYQVFLGFEDWQNYYFVQTTNLTIHSVNLFLNPDHNRKGVVELVDVL